MKIIDSKIDKEIFDALHKLRNNNRPYHQLLNEFIDKPRLVQAYKQELENEKGCDWCSEASTIF